MVYISAIPNSSQPNDQFQTIDFIAGCKGSKDKGDIGPFLSSILF